METLFALLPRFSVDFWHSKLMKRVSQTQLSRNEKHLFSPAFMQNKTQFTRSCIRRPDSARWKQQSFGFSHLLSQCYLLPYSRKISPLVNKSNVHVFWRLYAVFNVVAEQKPVIRRIPGGKFHNVGVGSWSLNSPRKLPKEDLILWEGSRRWHCLYHWTGHVLVAHP